MNVSEKWNSLQTIVRKEVKRCFRIWPQSFLPSVITMTLYYVVFGRVLGARIAPISGFSYIQYISPGLIMMPILLNSFSNTSSSFFGSKFSRCIEELMVSSMPMYLVSIGFLLGGVFRGVFVGFLVVLVSLFFTHLHISHPLIMVYSVLVTAVIFSLAGLINGIFARKFDDVSWIPSFVITPMTYLGGVFYSVHALPGIWRTLTMLDPIHYVVSSFRYSMLGVEGAHLLSALVVLSVLAVSMFVLSVYLLNNSRSMRD